MATRRKGSRVDHGARLRQKLQRMPPDITKALKDELWRSIRDVQQTAAELVPTDSGDGKRALGSKAAIGKKSNGFRVEFGLRTKKLLRDVFYLYFIEFGTKGGTIKSGPGNGRTIPPMKAQPFMKPALEKNRKKIRKRRVRVLRQVLERVAKGAKGNG